jgi:hypothetical protein
MKTVRRTHVRFFTAGTGIIGDIDCSSGAGESDDEDARDWNARAPGIASSPLARFFPLRRK